jgi:tetratricopeptide (TPR) repeat protein
LQRTELDLLWLIGVCHELLNQDQAALSVYDHALKQYPNDPDVWLRRGFIRHFKQRTNDALDDLRTAVHLRSEYCLPYLILAKREFDARDFWEAYRLAKSASEKKGTKSAPITGLSDDCNLVVNAQPIYRLD